MRQNFSLKITILLVLLGLQFGCSTQSESLSADASPKKNTIQFDSASLDKVMEYYGSISGKSVVLSTDFSSIRISLKCECLTDAQVLKAIEKILSINNIILVEDGEETIRVEPKSGPPLAGLGCPHPSANNNSVDSLHLTTVVFQFEHISALSAEEQLRSQLSNLDLIIPNPKIVGLQQSKAVMITTDIDDMKKIRTLIEKLDS